MTIITKAMITLLVEENNPLTPFFYNDFISKLQFHQLTCPCGISGCLSVHGYYYRSIKTSAGREKFRICRVICSCCGHTHAILLSSMVPYSQISFPDHVSIISNFENDISQTDLMNSNPYIDEGCFRYIVSMYLKYWKERLLSERICLSTGNLIKSCFSCFNRQFMQIKRTSNILFLNTT